MCERDVIDNISAERRSLIPRRTSPELKLCVATHTTFRDDYSRSTKSSSFKTPSAQAIKLWQFSCLPPGGIPLRCSGLVARPRCCSSRSRRSACRSTGRSPGEERFHHHSRSRPRLQHRPCLRAEEFALSGIHTRPPWCRRHEALDSRYARIAAASGSPTIRGPVDPRGLRQGLADRLSGSADGVRAGLSTGVGAVLGS